MSTIDFEAAIKIKYETDVLVLGAGPSGLCAAVAAARNGARTVLVEQAGFAGGMATAGLVNPFMTCYSKSSGIMIIRGLFKEVIERLIGRGAAVNPETIKAPSPFTSWITLGHDHVTPFDAEELKLTADEMLEASGVKVLYHTSFVKTLRKGDLVDAVIVNSKNGLEAIRAKLFIDCSGDADLAADGGAEFETGDEAKGLIQPASMFFRIGNADDKKVEADIEANRDNFYRIDGINYRSFHWRVSEARKAGDWHLERTSIGFFKGVNRGEWSVNTSRIMNVDGTNAESLTAAEIEGRRQVNWIFQFIKKYIPGCENAVLLSTASTVGIRETRHIKGDYTLRLDDLVNCVVSDDAVLLASNSIDIHGRYGPLSNEYVTINGEWYGIPYRSLVPQALRNVLVAGRALSADSEAAGAVRVMPVCMGTGQAAGTAAALALKEADPKGINVHAIDVRKLREILKQEDVFLG